jgi:hypothetical protein
MSDVYSEEAKNFRLGMLSAVFVVCVLFYFLFKVEVCKSSPSHCQDEFHELGPVRVACDTGAVAEMVTSPPAPKAGILCHCITNTAPSASVSKPNIEN